MKIRTMGSATNKGILSWFYISRTYHIQLKRYSQFLKTWSLTPSQYEVLVNIRESGRMSQKELAEKMFLTKGNITQLIIKMENEGYISREQEWKTKYIRLTEKGNQLLDRIRPEQVNYFSQQFQGLTKKEQKRLIKLLKKVNETQINQDNE
ncbi:MarR family transcriptional regulator [Sporolactobacillus shoreicorticis]|uniref:MarR family winged helix-turn-helix transcriptional regulator n=1 Tax=Sporolactobacillus shoreicorticis TaxID=1923877 RepID=A0ABW5S965_9BACL|nr:MarR family transcriptional regulator [Sporolactobacillus shoreicorticis]MCO7125745.1 MarR family transcriptional regulator [Sporolactobacillus shoreicorticis]